MKLTIKEVTDKIDKLEAVIDWAEEYYEHEAKADELDICQNNIVLLREYLQIILDTKVDL